MRNGKSTSVSEYRRELNTGHFAQEGRHYFLSLRTFRNAFADACPSGPPYEPINFREQLARGPAYTSSDPYEGLSI
ncbi:hypothetical protein EVAR_77878_1 [Eumeta japonica]|uniref:Uncharacterized protein n=1 Tax=Eumeta variegata TaxID=151549 RepID=A0A4C1TC95_EUMVA|nr:hypothetical protein EVAR_77878_1 [Eumeta japonica]